MMINPLPACDNPPLPAEIIAGRRREGTLPRVRSLQDAADEIRREDPDTPVTPYMLRRVLIVGHAVRGSGHPGGDE